jgi:hypothetical protein
LGLLHNTWLENNDGGCEEMRRRDVKVLANEPIEQIVEFDGVRCAAIRPSIRRTARGD